MVDLSRRAVLGGSVGAVALGATGLTSSVPATAAPLVSEEGLMDDKRAGQLRHFHNLMVQLPGDWSHMQGEKPGPTDEAAYQHQLAYMIYGVATAHYHRLPAAPGVFRADFDTAIQKMLRQEVWSYWETMSRGNKRDNPALTGPREAFWDPVIRENIIYSGHLVAMVALYGYMFNDDKYDRMGSISFSHPDPWDPRTVEYNIQSLSDVIYWQMVQNGYLGVACQPNRVFNVCNQFPIWGFRFRDAHKGTDVTTDLIASHKKAWQARGGYINGKPTPFEWKTAQDQVDGTLRGPGNFQINAWNPEYYQSRYSEQRTLLYRNPDGTIMGYPVTQWEQVLAAAAAGKALPPINRASVPNELNGTMGMLPGYEALNMSEAGDPDFDAFMRYVDLHRNPTWENGGLYYPRNDMIWDEAGNMVAVAPHAGNANYFWARMNMKNGLNIMFNSPWTRAHFAEPNLYDLDHNVDVTQARYLPEQNELLLAVKPPKNGDRVDARLVIANARRQGQNWTLDINGRQVATGSPDAVRSSHLPQATFEADKLVLRFPVATTAKIAMRWA